MTTIIDKQSELKTLARSIFAGIATPEDLSTADPNEVIAIKSDTSEPRRAIHVFEKVEKGTGTRTRRFIASTERVDRQGDIIRVKGWDLADFKKNPVALWCHMSRELPLGTVTEFVKETKGDNPALIESIDFHEESLYPFADQVMRFVDARGLRAVSVGFIPLAGGVKYPATPEERDAMGLGPWGVEYTKVSQLELSVCPVPAQADALGTKEIERAIGDLVRSKKLTPAQAKSLLDAASSPSVFAVGALPQAPAADATTEEPAEQPSPLERVMNSIERTLETLNRTLDENAQLRARVTELEGELATLKTKAPVSTAGVPLPVTTTEPKAAPTARASDPSAFYQALEVAVAKL